MKPGLLEQIKSRGYWRINFRPLTASIKLKTLQECKLLVERNSVLLRGWDYPHIPKRSDADSDIDFCGEYVEGWADWSGYKEFWRIYKSAQFLNYRALREDWYEQRDSLPVSSRSIKPGTALIIIGSVIYEITEVFEFLCRLAKQGIYEEGVIVKISLHNTQNRILVIEDPRRAPFDYPRKTGANEVVFSKTYTKSDILVNPKGLGTGVILQIFDAFGWTTSSEFVDAEQVGLYSLRF